MSKYSFMVPLAPARPEQTLPFAALAQWSSAYCLWQGQAPVADPHLAFGYAAACGFRVPVGIGVTLMPYRHPYQAALQAQELAIATGHRVVAGYGPGAAGLQRGMLGSAYDSQLTAVREYAGLVRGLLDGDTVRQQGHYFSYRGSLSSLPRPPVEVGLGVLRPGMARLAGEVADVAITWLTPAGYLRDVVVPALREGAENAGRPIPRLVAMVPVALSGPDRDPTELALASNSGHMNLPHYVDMLSRSGIDVDMSDPESSAKALVSGGAFVYGESSEVRDQLSEFARAGVDEVVLNATGVCVRLGNTAALGELEAVLGEVTS